MIQSDINVYDKHVYIYHIKTLNIFIYFINKNITLVKQHDKLCAIVL